jgi:hypothetical protein
MLKSVMQRPRETEAKALMGHEVGTYEEWLAARPGLFEGDEGVAHD